MTDTSQSLFQLAMSEEAQPLLHAVKAHITENVDPIIEEAFNEYFPLSASESTPRSFQRLDIGYMP